MKNTERLLAEFLERAKSLDPETQLIRVLRSNSFKIGQANVLVRTASDLGKRYFFGLNYINAEEIYNLENSFVAFVCGSIERIVFLPSDLLIKMLPEISHDRNGEYKINFTRNLSLVLRGRGHHFDCAQFINNWNLISGVHSGQEQSLSPDESFHNVIQGRLIEIGNIRGFRTFTPDKSRSFNRRKLRELTSLAECPQLQFADFDSVRKIDVMWFREVDKGFYPEYAFEVELSTGVWSGFGRLAALREYNTRLYVITNEDRRFNQVSNSFPDFKGRCISIVPEKVGLLYSAEISLIRMRTEFDL